MMADSLRARSMAGLYDQTPDKWIPGKQLVADGAGLIKTPVSYEGR